MTGSLYRAFNVPGLIPVTEQLARPENVNMGVDVRSGVRSAREWVYVHTQVSFMRVNRGFATAVLLPTGADRNDSTGRCYFFAWWLSAYAVGARPFSFLASTRKAAAAVGIEPATLASAAQRLS